ncbi:MAG: FkbM family methyltransferase [Proteobacteria bacterium]|nr:FkbM family methyltransferase [Pseudomonadota bacterium]
MIASARNILRHKGVFGLAVATYYLAWINLYRRVLGRRYMRKRIHSSPMILDVDDRGICRTLLLFGRREEEHRVILETVLKRGMTVLDIGANVGYYALMEYRCVGPTGRIVAVEPSPQNAALLERNLALNGVRNVSLFHGAISDRPGTRQLALSAFSNLHSFHGEESPTGEVIDVEMRTVPQAMEGSGAPDLIRMDVEGHEVEVLNGMLDAVERGEMAPMILFETHRRKYGPDHDLVAPLRRLFACGYHARYIGSSSRDGTGIVEGLGYRGGPPIETDFMERVIFENIHDDDLIDLVCRTGGVRTVLLVREQS